MLITRSIYQELRRRKLAVYLVLCPKLLLPVTNPITVTMKYLNINPYLWPSQVFAYFQLTTTDLHSDFVAFLEKAIKVQQENRLYALGEEVDGHIGGKVQKAPNEPIYDPGDKDICQNLSKSSTNIRSE